MFVYINMGNQARLFLTVSRHIWNAGMHACAELPHHRGRLYRIKATHFGKICVLYTMPSHLFEPLHGISQSEVLLPIIWHSLMDEPPDWTCNTRRCLHGWNYASLALVNDFIISWTLLFKLRRKYHFTNYFLFSLFMRTYFSYFLGHDFTFHAFTFQLTLPNSLLVSLMLLIDQLIRTKM